MKRTGVLLGFAALLSCAASASEEPPPQIWEGWQIRGPSGEPPVILEPGSPVGPGVMSASTLTAAFSLPPAQEPRGPVVLGFGLQTNLPVSTSCMVSEIARGLDYNWLLCYLFVRDNIRFTPYKGIARGPERTLIDREGNDADQSLLLFALLRASGYSSSTVCYTPIGTFRMQLAGGADGYDAAHWLGVPAEGTVAQLTNAVSGILGPSGVPFGYALGATPAQSEVSVEHFCVYLPDLEDNPFLDPSFKPKSVREPSGSLPADMGYARSNLLARAGGTVTNDWFVQGLSYAEVSNELNRLSANLAAAWRSAGTGATSGDFVGWDGIVPQDFSTDESCFHGWFYDYDVYDFLSQSDAFKNGYRARMYAVWGGITNACWLDEIGARTLWISFTNAPTQYPKAILRLDDNVIATEPAGSSSGECASALGVYHPAIGGMSSASYTLSRAVTNVYVIPVGFGADTPGGMREWAARELGRLKGNGLPEGDLKLRAAVLHSLGQQWLGQCAMLNALYSRLGGGHARHSFFEAGVVGHEAASLFDFKTGYAYTSASGVSALYGGRIFESSLEHGVLDQANGPERPAVSTVRVVSLANGNETPVYLASSSNWQTVQSSLTGYSSALVSYLSGNVEQGQKFLLPQNGQVTLGQWSGAGFFSYGPKGSGSLLSGGLNGGYTAYPGYTYADRVVMSQPRVIYQGAEIQEVMSADPVDMRSGAAVIGRTDLVAGGLSPIVWERHYDSRQRGVGGPVGRGWSHSYDGRLIAHADPESFMGRIGAPAACAASAVACTVVRDLLSAGESARHFTLACLVADWWAAQLRVSGATVTAGGKSLTFTRLTDGSYESGPGVTAALRSAGSGGCELEERLGRTWTFSAAGALSSIHDCSGNAVGLEYAGGTNLVSLTNAFGSKLELGWSGGRIETVSDNAGRTVRYAYSPDGCLTGVTDAAGYVWNAAYDQNGTFVLETDPSGQPTVRNAYNEFAQVTNQLSGSGQLWRFAYAGGLRSWEADPFLKRANHGFTAEGRPAWRLEKDGAFYEFAYDGRGNAVTNVDALGRVTVSEFDASNRLTRVTEAVGTQDERTTDFAYDGRHRLVAITNALGRVTRMGYDGCDRLSLTVLPDGASVTNVYDARGLLTLTRALDAVGHAVRETSYVRGSRGLADEMTSTDAGTTYYKYDAAGNVTNIVDAIGHLLALSYNARGQLTGTADALGHTTASLYTPEGRLEAALDALGRTNRFLWTPGGKPAAVIYPDGGVSTNEYDIADRLAAVKDPRGSRVAFGLDAVGRVTNRMAAAWSDYAWYDAGGRIIARVDAVSGLTETVYDNLDRPVAVTDPMGGSWTNSYDAAGALTGSRDPRGRTTAYARDAVGRLTATTYPSGRAVGNGYDALGRLTSFTNAEGRVYRMSYDAHGRLLAATNAVDEQVFRNFYDLVGNLTNKVDAASRRTEFTYDALNRLTATDYADGAWDRFGYDAAGNLLTASNAVSRLAFTYDTMNRLASAETLVAGQTFIVGYGYDRGGLATNIVYPDGKRIRYGYDLDGRVTNVTDWANHAWTFTRDAAGRLTALSYPNGVTGAWTHDARHAVASCSYNNGSPFAGRTITHDEAGVKIEEQVTAGLFPNPQSPRRAQNVFDAADRLTSATVAEGTNTYAEEYLYDLSGALTNRYSEIGGQRSEIGEQQFEYDCAGRLTYSQQSTVDSLALTYDALGNRLTTYSANATRIWITDHTDPRKRPLMETDSNGVPVRYFIWSGGLLLAVVEADGTMRYAHSDEQGSVVALTDSTGTVTDQYCYGPYGADWGHTGTNSIPFRWLGSHGVFNVGGSALYLTRFRAFDANMGRFLSQDPIGLGGGPNLYAYCLGSPLAYIDPLGLGAESRYNDRLNTINGAKALLQNQYGPVMGLLAGYVADILNRSVTTAYNAEKTGISPENAFVLGQIQGISEASAASATAGLLGLAGGELLGSATALLPVAGAVSGQVLPRGEGVLVAITPNGAVISSSNLMLSHPVFAQQAGLVTSNGGLVPGAFVGTAFNNAGTIAVLNSMSFYGNQAVASPGVQAIVSGVISAR